MIAADQLSEAFVAMADSLVDDFDLIEFLQDLTRRAATISGAAAVGLVLADDDGRPRHLAASNDSGEFLELLQQQTEEGPCLDCLRTGVPVVNVDLAHADDVWPDFAPRAAAAGFRSVHTFPLRLRQERIGALNLFGDATVHFADDEVRCVQALADVATIALLQERALSRAEALNEQLQAALASRVVIEQAKGVLAQAEGVTLDQAFAQLRATARASQQARRRRPRDAGHDGTPVRHLTQVAVAPAGGNAGRAVGHRATSLDGVADLAHADPARSAPVAPQRGCAGFGATSPERR